MVVVYNGSKYSLYGELLDLTKK